MIRLIKLVAGVVLFAFGIVTMIMANIGFAPWEVFHVGFALTTGLSIGVASIISGLAILIFVTACGETLGLGTLLSIVLTGLFIDLIMILNVIPKAQSPVTGAAMLIAGIFILSFGSYIYMNSAFGVGPRDNLMVVLSRRSRLPVGVCRGIVELLVTVGGWAMGGMVGVGTIIFVVLIGFSIQLTFKIFKFDVKAVKHETLGETFAIMRNLYSGRGS